MGVASGRCSQVDSGWTGDFGSLALSPDGKRLAVSIVDATGEQIWVKHLGVPHGPLSKLTFEGVNIAPQWHPDGKQVLFVEEFLASHNLRVVHADGNSAAPTELLHIPDHVYNAKWSADGRWVVYEFRRTGSLRDIAGVRPGVDSSPVSLAQSKFAESNPSISPNGRWLLYDANTTGSSEVYVRPFPNASTALHQISSGGGSRPRWSPDGREIFFVNKNRELVRVAVVPGDAFAFSDQRVLFSLRGIANWDVAPDGQRFIMIRDREGRGRRKLVVVENVFQELKAKAPR